MTDERSRTAVELAERFADGEATKEELAAAQAAAGAAARAALAAADEDDAPLGAANAAANAALAADAAARADGDYVDPYHAATAAAQAAADDARAAFLDDSGCETDASEAAGETTLTAAEKDQTVILRDIIGNPFRLVTIAPAGLAWNGGIVVKLAQGIYKERAFDRLPILADALEDAGCDNADILDHCRQPGPHVRGCWVVDLLTGRS